MEDDQAFEDSLTELDIAFTYAGLLSDSQRTKAINDAIGKNEVENIQEIDKVIRSINNDSI